MFIFQKVYVSQFAVRCIFRQLVLWIRMSEMKKKEFGFQILLLWFLWLLSIRFDMAICILSIRFDKYKIHMSAFIAIGLDLLVGIGSFTSIFMVLLRKN